MALLTRAERQKLIELLLQLPNSSNPAARSLLLADLPPQLQYAIAFEPAPANHIASIVNIVTSDAWEQLPDSTIPLQVVIENAIFSVRGSQLAVQLQSFLATVKTRSGQGAAIVVEDGGTLSNLTGAQYQQLHSALLSAFPSPDALRQMVYFGLDQNLVSIAGGNDLSAVTLSLIEWARAYDKIKDLIQAARAANPGNPQLRAFAAQVGLANPG